MRSTLFCVTAASRSTVWGALTGDAFPAASFQLPVRTPGREQRRLRRHRLQVHGIGRTEPSDTLQSWRASSQGAVPGERPFATSLPFSRWTAFRMGPRPSLALRRPGGRTGCFSHFVARGRGCQRLSDPTTPMQSEGGFCVCLGGVPGLQLEGWLVMGSGSISRSTSLCSLGALSFWPRISRIGQGHSGSQQDERGARGLDDGGVCPRGPCRTSQGWGGGFVWASERVTLNQGADWVWGHSQPGGRDGGSPQDVKENGMAR